MAEIGDIRYRFQITKRRRFGYIGKVVVEKYVQETPVAYMRVTLANDEVHLVPKEDYPRFKQEHPFLIRSTFVDIRPGITRWKRDRWASTPRPLRGLTAKGTDRAIRRALCARHKREARQEAKRQRLLEKSYTYTRETPC